MKERPILFSAPMVRALIDGRKTQTRRVVKGDVPTNAVDFTTYHHPKDEDMQRPYWWAFGDGALLDFAVPCPYGKPGDRLWVKETWRPHGVLSPWDIEVAYTADGERRTIKDGEFGESDWTMPKAAARGNVSPLFMPRWASRITLEITDVRVERLKDISYGDAQAEGWPPGDAIDPITWYSVLWRDINGAESWAANPWVWVIEFKRIDAIAMRGAA